MLGMLDSEGNGSKILRNFTQLLPCYQSEISQKIYITVRISILHYDQQNYMKGTMQ
jgi:hypothetical protein